jgi:hypothetical protein
MIIEFHCEHCAKIVKAPPDAGGRRGKCPHCGGLTYIPLPVEDTGELELAPFDEAEEARQKNAIMEAAALQQRLLRERSIPGEPPGKGARGQTSSPSVPSSSSAPSGKALSAMIVSFVESMSTGKLDRAEELVQELSRHREKAKVLLDEMSGEDLAAYGMPALPKPVLLGFLKQLRAKL